MIGVADLALALSIKMVSAGADNSGTARRCANLWYQMNNLWSMNERINQSSGILYDRHDHIICTYLVQEQLDHTDEWASSETFWRVKYV